VTDPAKQSAGTDPDAGRYYQPEDPAQNFAVVDLAHAWDEEAEHCRKSGIPHLASNDVTAGLTSEF